ncbi:energy transducer TonB [Ramlibacter sp. PS3R-8]|uniref:energy transducer TonB n=1 Tax=Ramlibacter sp. PS3R-8 TaxID=3133437 RepID=UPI0030ADDA46
MERRRGFWQAVAVTLLGHGAVFAWLATVQPAPALHGALHGAPLAFQVRPVQPTATAEPAPTAPETPAALRGTTESIPPPVAAAATAPTLGPATPERTAAPAPDAPYLPRGQLTVTPKLVGHVDVPFPNDVDGTVDLKVRVTLFIDERGAVQKLRLDSPDVHPAFERSIREAFAAARFSPGEVDRVAVRSQVRLEIDFQAPTGRKS